MSLIASCNGLLKINVDRLNGINAIADVMMATLHTHQLVKMGRVGEFPTAAFLSLT